MAVILKENTIIVPETHFIKLLPGEKLTGELASIPVVLGLVNDCKIPA